MGPEHLSKLTVDIVNIQSLFGLFLASFGFFWSIEI